MADFMKAMDYTFPENYADHPNDPGRRMNFWITEQTARAYGYTGDMKNLTREDAVNIYRKGWWDYLQLDDVKSDTMATEIFYTSVLCGYFVAIDILQKVLNARNIKNKHGNDIKVDGKMSPETIERLNAMSSDEKSERRLWYYYNILQGAFHIVKSLQDPRLRVFIDWWTNNSVELN
jgi:lysozyme family protein